MTPLEFINEQMTALNINYADKEWTNEDVPKLYFIGEEYTEDGTKDNVTTSTLTIKSYNSGGFKDFFEAVNKIKKHFGSRTTKCTVKTENGSVWVFLGGCEIIPPTEQGKRTTAKIILKIKETILTGT